MPDALRVQSFLSRRDRSLAELLVGWLLLPLALMYLIVVALRRFVYSAGFLKSTELSVKVISIGGITTGGSGKTPTVIHVANLLESFGKRAIILTRGYGGEVDVPTVLLPGRNGHEHNQAGMQHLSDEVRLMAARTKSVIGVGRDRIASFKRAAGSIRFDLALLDDGLQHLAIRRDLEIVVLDATAPFGSGYLLPSGNLREPRSVLRRADLILLTRISQADDSQRLKGYLVKTYGDGRVITADYVRDCIVKLRTGDSVEPAELSGVSLCAVAAIANPGSFFRMVEDEGMLVRHTRVFVDHHVFTQVEISELIAEARTAGCQALIVTEKDAMKFQTLDFGGLDVFVYRIRLQIVSGETNLRQSLQGLFDDQA